MEAVKIIVVLRSARTALGWTQQEFADKMGVAKSTVARIETMEVSAKADFLIQALKLFKASGVEIEMLASDKVTMTVLNTALHEAQSRLANEHFRRSDRKGMRKPSPKGLLDPLPASAEPKLPGDDERFSLAA